ncbi:hypothetical protein DFH09DRAFT_1111023, partial [Mycena vulgaris]
MAPLALPSRSRSLSSSQHQIVMKDPWVAHHLFKNKYPKSWQLLLFLFESRNFRRVKGKEARKMLLRLGEYLPDIAVCRLEAGNALPYDFDYFLAGVLRIFRHFAGSHPIPSLAPLAEYLAFGDFSCTHLDRRIWDFRLPSANSVIITDDPCYYTTTPESSAQGSGDDSDDSSDSGGDNDESSVKDGAPSWKELIDDEAEEVAEGYVSEVADSQDEEQLTPPRLSQSAATAASLRRMMSSGDESDVTPAVAPKSKGRKARPLPRERHGSTPPPSPEVSLPPPRSL